MSGGRALRALAAVALAGAGWAARAGEVVTLDGALAEAARASAVVRLSRADLDQAGVEAYASYAGVLPRLDLTASFGHDFVGPQSTVATFPTGFGASGDPTFQQKVVSIPATDNADYGLGLSLQLPLFDGARSWNGIRRARASERAQERAYDEARLAVSFDVTRRFFEVLKAQESVAVLEETAARSEENVRHAEALFDAGRGSRLDIVTARGNLGSDRIAVESARARLAQARADLAASMGRSAAADALVAAPPPGVLEGRLPPREEPPPLEELIERARRSRPLLLSQGHQIRAAELGESIARGAWSPVVSAQTTYTRQGPTLSGSDAVYGDPSRQYTASAQILVQWNLFDGRQTVAEQRRAATATDRARATAKQADEQVVDEIAHARADVVSQAHAAAIAAENLATAEQGVSLARARLDAGAAGQLEVRDASLKLTQARLTLLTARIDYVVAGADLNRAVGGSL